MERTMVVITTSKDREIRDLVICREVALFKKGANDTILS